MLQVHPGCTCACVSTYSIPSLVCTFTHMYMQDTIPGGVCWSCEACQWCSGGRPLFTPLWPCQCLPVGQPLLQWMDDTAWQCVQRQRTGWVQPSNTPLTLPLTLLYMCYQNCVIYNVLTRTNKLQLTTTLMSCNYDQKVIVFRLWMFQCT